MDKDFNFNRVGIQKKRKDIIKGEKNRERKREKDYTNDRKQAKLKRGNVFYRK
jgi:hypothetical protein